MTIFFAGAIRGGRARQPEYAFIVRALGRYGEVHSPFTHDDALSEYGETDLPAADIAARELGALAKSDVIVAEVTVPSLGVGYLIAHAAALGKKIVALYRGKDALKLSAMIKGEPAVLVRTYETEREVETILNELLGGDAASARSRPYLTS